MAQIKFFKYSTTSSIPKSSAFDPGSIIFDDEAKILYLVRNDKTLSPYYGTDTKYSFSNKNNVLTITPSSGNSYSLTIDNVSHAGLADSATNDSEGREISKTYVKKSGDTVSGTLNIDDLIVGNIIVNGAARFLNEITGTAAYATRIGTADNNLTYDNITSYINAKADRTIKVSAGSGLTGGGNLSSNITISHANTSDQSSVDGGTTQYIKSVALDDFGHVTGMSLANLPTNVATATTAQVARYADAIRHPDYHDMSHRLTSMNQLFSDGAIHYFLATSSCTEGKPACDSQIIHTAWDNSNIGAQISVPHDENTSIQWRTYNNSWSNWISIIDQNNWKAYIGTTSNPVANATNASTATNAGTATRANSITTEIANTSSDRPVYFAYDGDNTKVVYDNDFKYNPNTNNLSVVNINGGTPITSINISSQSVSHSTTADSATTASNSILFNGYSFNDLKFNCINTRSITVEGDKDTFYPVGIRWTYDKRWCQYISVQKNLGSKTPSYEGNHSNGTSSCWFMYEGRFTGWDGNGGFVRTLWDSQIYAPVVANTSSGNNGCPFLIVWLRGGGCSYDISSSESLTDGQTESDYKILIKYEKFNFGFSETYPVYFEPIPLANLNSCNKGVYNSTYSYYKSLNSYNADQAANATHAGAANSATKADYPTGFQSRETSASWGTLKADNGFTYVTDWHDSGNGDIGFWRKGAELYMQIDGYIYQNEGAYLVLDQNNWVNYIGTSSNPVQNAINAASIPWSGVQNKPNLVTLDTEQTITSSKTFNCELNIDSANLGNLIVNGASRFLNTITGNLKGDVDGNAKTATNAVNAAVAGKVSKVLKWGSKSYDGSSEQTITAADLGLSGAMRFIGSTTSAISEGSKTNPVTVNGSSVTALVGDVVLYNHVEYIWTGSWEQLGDEQSFALKSIQILAGDGMTGGGSLSNNVTIAHGNVGVVSSTKGNETNKAISAISVDKFGHVSSVSTVSIPTKLSDLTPDLSSVYLPTTGGNMNHGANISWSDTGSWSNNNTGVTFPYECGGLIWSEQSDYVKLYTEATASDNLDLIIQFGDDNSNGLQIRNRDNVKTAGITATGIVTASSFVGNLDGNAKTATYASSATNAEKLSNFTITDILPYNSTRDFSNGTLITTDINTTYNNVPFYLTIEGNGYSDGVIHICVSGYIYHADSDSTDIRSYQAYNFTSNPFGNIWIQLIDDKLCFWFGRNSYWQGFKVKCTVEYGSGTVKNRVVSITDVAKPTATLEQELTPIHAISSANISEQSVKYAVSAATASNASQAAIASRLSANDTRSSNENPYSLDTGVSWHLKETWVIGLSDTGSYAGLLSLRPWGDNSGGYHYELAFCNDAIRYRKGTTTWSDWLKLATTSDIPTKLSQFIDDLGNTPTHTHNQYALKAGDTITGKYKFTAGLESDSVTTEDLIVNGSARFVSGLTSNANITAPTFTGDLKGNADTATNAQNSAKADLATKADTVTTVEASADSNRPVFFAYAGDNSKICYNTNFQYNPSTKNLFVSNINGGTPITSANISSQSVASAKTAESATTAGQIASHTLWGQTFNGTQDINGNITITSGFMVSGAREINNEPGDTNHTLCLGYTGHDYVEWKEYGGDWRFIQSKSGTNTTQVLLGATNYFLNNVGIGNQSPAYKLDVTGTARITGDVVMSSNLNVAATTTSQNVTATNQVKGKTINIDSGCTLQYDSTEQCVKFVFA